MAQNWHIWLTHELIGLSLGIFQHFCFNGWWKMPHFQISLYNSSVFFIFHIAVNKNGLFFQNDLPAYSITPFHPGMKTARLPRWWQQLLPLGSQDVWRTRDGVYFQTLKFCVHVHLKILFFRDCDDVLLTWNVHKLIIVI